MKRKILGWLILLGIYSLMSIGFGWSVMNKFDEPISLLAGIGIFQLVMLGSGLLAGLLIFAINLIDD